MFYRIDDIALEMSFDGESDRFMWILGQWFSEAKSHLNRKVGVFRYLSIDSDKIYLRIDYERDLFCRFQFGTFCQPKCVPLQID